MQLFYSPTSPFARKTRVAVREYGLADRVEEVAVDPWQTPIELVQHNPLSKIPALRLDDGMTLPDSELIMDYLDSLAATGARDWSAARRARLGDGLIEAAVAMIVELKKRPAELFYQGRVDRQIDAIRRTLDVLEGEASALGADTGGRTEITLGCALGYIDFRFPELDWRGAHPAIAAWYARFSARPSMQATKPPV